MTELDEIVGELRALGVSDEQMIDMLRRGLDLPAEDALINGLSVELGVTLEKHRFPLPGGKRLEVDGFCKSPPILCEVNVHFGPPKGVQRAKVMADAFKLVYANRRCMSSTEPTRLILLFPDEEAAKPFKAGTWVAEALKASDIEVQVGKLPQNLSTLIRFAKGRTTP